MSVSFPITVAWVFVSQLALAQGGEVIPADTPAPAIDRGRFVGNAYVNDFLGLSYPLPDEWFVNPDLSPVPAGAVKKLTSGALLLFVADKRRPQGNFRNRVLLIADDASNYDPGLTAEGYAAKFMNATGQKQAVEPLQSATVEFAVQHFHRADYRDGSETAVLYKSFVCTKVKGYWVSWTFVGGSSTELDELVNSLKRLSLQTVENPVELQPARSAEPSSIHNGAAHGQASTGPIRRVRISQMVSDAFVIRKIQPAYPDEARRQHVHGNVVLKAEISHTGDVSELTVVSGDPLLAPSALEAVKQWKYKPYLLNGQPVDVETQVTVTYQLSP